VVHLITYELVGARLPDEVARLEAVIKSLGAAYAFAKTAWFVECEETNAAICQKLGEVLRPRDRLVVTRVHRDWVATNVPQVEVDWLSQRNFHAAQDANPAQPAMRFQR
jgi:hypothetical protein